VPVTYVNFITIVVTASGEKVGSFAYVPPLALQSIIRLVLHICVSEYLYFFHI